MARIPYVDPAAAPERVRDMLAKMQPPLNVYHVVAHAETLFPHWARLGGAILARMQLDARLRELVILRVARLSRCDYEWTQHVPIGQAFGITDEQIAALAEERIDTPSFDDTDRLVLRVTDEAVRDVRVSDATFAAVVDRFSDREVVELLMTVGFYLGLARVIESTGVDLDRPAGTALVDGLRRRGNERA